MRTNCIVLDNGYSYSMDSKTIQTFDGKQIADLYDIDTSKLTELEIIRLTILFSLTYEKGRKSAEKEFQEKINNFFGFSIDKWNKVWYNKYTIKERGKNKMKWLKKLKERRLKKYWENLNSTFTRYTEGG